MSPIRQLPELVLATLVALTVAAAQPALAVEEGERAPSFRAEGLSGEKLALASYKGKVVYLDFWASWCGPCLRSLPLMEKLRTELPAADFQVLAVNLDRDKKKAIQFMKDQGIQYPSASDPEGTLPKLFGLETMPTSYVIDRKGVVTHVHRGFSPGDMDSIRQEIESAIGRK